MARLTLEELDAMRQLATMGYVPFWGTIDAERPEDFEVTLRRSQIADYQNALLRAVEEIERCYERFPAE